MSSIMASVHRKEGSKFWYGAFRLPDGKLVLRSTKSTRKPEALRIARDWEDATRLHAQEAQIRKVFEDLHERLHGKRMRTDTVREFFLRWIGRREGELAASTCRDYRGGANLFFDHLGDRADKPIAELVVSDLTAFRDREATRTSIASAQNRIRQIKPWIIDAWRDGLLVDNIGTKLARSKRQSGKTKRRPFTREELKLIIENASPEWQGAVLMGIYTGQRLGDVASLHWNQVDLMREQIAFRTSKTGRQQIIPIVGAWRKWLMDHAGDDAEGPVFPEMFEAVRQAGGKTGTLSNRFRAIMESAGIVEKRTHSKAKDGRAAPRESGGLSFHCLRYTTTTMLKQAGIAESIVRDLVGHESALVSTHYTVLDEDTKRAALAKLPEEI